MRNAYMSTLYELAKKNKQIMAIVADIGAIVFDKFKEDFPDQFVNVGVAEQNLIGVAAGLASCGKIPFTYTITPFITMRPYEQIKNDVCLQNTNVKIVGVGAGLCYSTLGPTHHAIEDIAIMRVLPNMTIVSPADPLEAKKTTIAAAQLKGPVYLRIGTRGEPAIYQEDYNFKLGKGVELKDGADIAIFSTGSITYDVLEAARELEREKLSVKVINIHTIKPLDVKMILETAKATGSILTVEEHNIDGGFGSGIAEVLLESKIRDIKFKRLGIKDCFCSFYGTHKDLKAHFGLSKEDIKRETRNLYKQKK